jgi:outer membrane protein
MKSGSLHLPCWFAGATVFAGALGLHAPAMSYATPDPDAATSTTGAPPHLDLPGAIAYALAHNYAIQQARERIRQQQGVEVTVQARTIPNVGAGGSYTGNSKEISTYQGAQDQAWNLNVQARQVLFAGGGVQASVRGARLAREAAELDLQGVINQQLLGVRVQFYSVLLAKEKIAVQEQNVQLLEQQLKDAKSRFNAGTTSNFELLRAQVALANGQPPLIQARNDYRIAIEQLRQGLGMASPSGPPMPRELEIQGTLSAGPPVDYQLSSAIETARTNRPELQRLGKLVGAGEQEVKSSRAPYFPEIDAVGGYTWTRGLFSAIWRNRLEGWTAGVQGNWSIFDGRATTGRVIQAKSALTQTKLSLDEATLAIEVQVRQAYSSLVEAWELVQASSKTVEQAQEALRLANVRYNAGSATQLDVLTSQVSLTEARLNQLQAYYGYKVALAGMRQAIGQADESVP